jgi:hypothetical protein
MTEHIREEQLALYAGGDLPHRESSAVAAHVQDCPECHQALAEFYDTQNFLTGALQNPTAGELSEVRKRLLKELPPRWTSQRRWTPWMIGAAAAILAMLFLSHGLEHKAAIGRKEQPIVVLPHVTEKLVSRPAAGTPHLLRAASRKKRLRPREAGIRTVSLIARADQAPTIKMTTVDPNVVILWQTNERTGQEP